MSNGLASPTTPSPPNADLASQPSHENYSVYPDPTSYDSRSMAAYPREKQSSSQSPTISRPTAYHQHAPGPYESEPLTQVNGTERHSSTKRYPCRFKDSHHCDKTFTTSGHASRHSRIHTAEKAVHCDFPGCHKKFTRADNMKQHHETHYKEKSRNASKTSAAGPLTRPAGIKKREPSISVGRTSRGSSMRPEVQSHESSLYPRDDDTYSNGSEYSPRASPREPSSLDMHLFQRALPHHEALPYVQFHRRTSCGLDKLAALADVCTKRSA